MKMISKLERFFRWLINARWLWTNAQIATLQDYRNQLLQQPRYQDEKRLNRYEYQVFSQNGEDGIIAEIFRRIGEESRFFIEIGVGNGLENNTTYLLQQGWGGYWVEGDADYIRFIRKHFKKVIENGFLSVGECFMHVENVGEILMQIRNERAVDLLSVDIDRNTFYVLDAILQQKIVPRVIVAEYNSLYPPPMDWKVEYSSEKMWNRSSYFGASLKAYELLGRKFGYSLVGCDVCGVNAFFVRDDLVDNNFLYPYSAENHYEPLRDYLLNRVGFARQYSDIS
jgi:hypothetical protein